MGRFLNKKAINNYRIGLTGIHLQDKKSDYERKIRWQIKNYNKLNI